MLDSGISNHWLTSTSDGSSFFVKFSWCINDFFSRLTRTLLVDSVLPFGFSFGFIAFKLLESRTLLSAHCGSTFLLAGKCKFLCGDAAFCLLTNRVLRYGNYARTKSLLK